MNWDQRFLAMCALVGSWSKDPSTKCGAVIVRGDRTVASLGFNGFPRHMEDRDTRYINREDKYGRVIHAEMNAILVAKEPLRGMTMYCSHFTCHRCAVHIIQAGITRVIMPKPSDEFMERWADSVQLAMDYYAECNVVVTLV